MEETSNNLAEPVVESRKNNKGVEMSTSVAGGAHQPEKQSLLDTVERDCNVNGSKVTENSQIDSVKLSSSDSQTSQKHWFWKSWIILALFGALSFAVTNFLIGDLAAIGAAGVVYFCTGSLCFTSIYFFAIGACWKKHVLPLDGPLPEHRTRLITKSVGGIDWYMILLYFVGAFTQIAIFMSIAYCFYFSRKAGLNVGIAQAIWAINPFLVAVIQYFKDRVALQMSQVIGMLALVLCALLVSLSQLLPSEQLPVDVSDALPVTGDSAVESSEAVTLVEYTTPTYVAVLFSLIMPTVCVFYVFLNQYIAVHIKLSGNDWTFGYFWLMSLIL